ncbi:MAG: hypothetical protein JKY71_06775 [Alphaproteobacteria bacterium]|nr:hypothetical protein [Alphaproteobacteria bacterium]|tara:strand:- start:17 stop:241 length:225 start_codon:yes stop_codon:yes gene_type:complete
MSGSIYDTFVNNANEVSEESVGMAFTGIRLYEDGSEPSYLQASISTAVENRLGNDAQLNDTPAVDASLQQQLIT